MGDWSISIQGTGAHHNKDHPNDADKLTARFVESLIRAGHTVHSSCFVSGGRTEWPETTFPATADLEARMLEYGWAVCEAGNCYFAGERHIHRAGANLPVSR